MSRKWLLLIAWASVGPCDDTHSPLLGMFELDILRNVLLRVSVISLPLDPVCEASTDVIRFFNLVEDMPCKTISNLQCDNLLQY